MSKDLEEPAAKKQKRASLRVCFVGCGNIADYHLKAAIACGRVAVTALVDPSAESRKRLSSALQTSGHPSPKEFSTLEEALAADPDTSLFEACDIMVPSWLVGGKDLHETVASVALRAQRHVLLEKPVCVTTEAAQRLIALHQEVAPSKVFAVAENAQFWPEILAAKACIEAGKIGDILTGRAKFLESAMGEWACDYLPGTWRCDAAKLPAASFTYDGASHFIRPLRMWFGEVEDVVGLGGCTLPHMPGMSWSQHVFKFTSGKSAIFESLLAPKAVSDQPFFSIQGTLGEIVIDGFAGGCRSYTPGDDGNSVITTDLCKEGWDAGYAGEYVDFVAATLDGVPTAGPASEALKDLQVVSALFQSSDTKQWVKCA